MVSVNVFPFLLFVLDVHENELAEELDKMIDMIKGGLSLKIKKIHIHLYIELHSTLWKYTLVEDIDNWTPMS